jgi:hypothetical protein
MVSLPLSLSLPVHPHHLYYKMEETKFQLQFCLQADEGGILAD